MKGLNGKTIALASLRKSKEISQLIKKHGGNVKTYALQGTRFLREEEILKDINQFIESDPDWAIFTTGMGADALFTTAEKHQMLEPFIDHLKRAKIAARGRKTVQCLNKYRLAPVITAHDGTVKGLIENFRSAPLKGKRVFLQLYGESAPELVHWLKRQEAELIEVMPYRHIPPEQNTVQALAEEIIFGHVDAAVFTSAIQVKHLFAQIKSNDSIYHKVIAAFNKKVAACAVGQVTSNALKDNGVKRVIAPDNQRMGAMIVKLSNYFRE
ncbi:uroporphyrinogen-III synthase [Scopulibacillus daqui]|uniref:Uroporphyrinogen-III synthase n=1 Tax=Scopulibacillus daqui TaxID=1469162 RepID=A0ABS2PXZ8_9BACL|nr:uroporphyrinogen-III synthase [Scopulibacillus daqui]MBM7644816.1 uroporphyrinogen-III synthase [Scopulibacillus daqui]